MQRTEPSDSDSRADDFFLPGANIAIEARPSHDGADGGPASYAGRNSLRCLLPTIVAAALLFVGGSFAPGEAFAAKEHASADAESPKRPTLSSDLPEDLSRSMNDSLSSLARESIREGVKGLAHASPAAKFVPGGWLKPATCNVSMNGLDRLYIRVVQPKGSMLELSEYERNLQRYKSFRELVALHETAHCELRAGVLRAGAAKRDGPWKEVAGWLDAMQAAGDVQQIMATGFAYRVMEERYADARALIEIARSGGDVDSAIALVLTMRSKPSLDDIRVLEHRAGKTHTMEMDVHQTTGVVQRLARWHEDAKAGKGVRSFDSMTADQASEAARHLAVASIASDLPSLMESASSQWAKDRGQDRLFEIKAEMRAAGVAVSHDEHDRLVRETREQAFKLQPVDAERMTANALAALGPATRALQASWDRGEIPEAPPAKVSGLIARLQGAAAKLRNDADQMAEGQDQMVERMR